jgi:hypothetical protein
MNARLTELPVRSGLGLSWLVPSNDELGVENEKGPKKDNAEKREKQRPINHKPCLGAVVRKLW